MTATSAAKIGQATTGTIRVAGTGDLDAIASYLSAALHGGPPARYRAYFEYTWLADKPDLGVLIEDQGQIRGFVGAIYADRRVAGALVRFCDICGIAVDEPYRHLTLKLFSALVKRRELTFTARTTTPEVDQIFRFFKFARVTGDRVMVAPISGLSGIRHGLHAARPRVITRPTELRAELDPEHQTIARDHAAYRVSSMLITRGPRRSFVVTARRGHGLRAYADVLHASDPDLLLDCLPWVHGPLLRAHGTVLTAIESRWVRRAPLVSVIHRKLPATYARSATVGIDQIDALYSELVPRCGRRPVRPA